MQNFQNAIDAIDEAQAPISISDKQILIDNLISAWNEVVNIYSEKISNISAMEIELSTE